MKKLFLAIALLIGVSSVNAQKITGGIAVSPIISWMKPDISQNIENDGVRFGFSYGLVGDYNLNDNFAFSSGINVNNFGGQLEYLDSIPAYVIDNGTIDTMSFKSNAIVTYKFQYVEIPISIKGKTNEIGYLTYFMHAGINPMFRWKAKGDVSQDNVTNVSLKEEVSGLLMAFSVGGGIEYSLGGNTKLLVDLIYKNGLTDVTKTKTFHLNDVGAGDILDEKIILNSIEIKLGILF